ncbi:cytochrome c biogenesis FN [Tanacetum coccineum]
MKQIVPYRRKIRAPGSAYSQGLDSMSKHHMPADVVTIIESNPVPQDPISAIHPPCIYCRIRRQLLWALAYVDLKNDEGIVAAPIAAAMRKDECRKDGRLFRSAGCVGSVEQASSLPSYSTTLWALKRHPAYFGALVDTMREQAKRVVFIGKKGDHYFAFYGIAGANTCVLDQDQEPIRILILTCRWFLTVGHFARKLVGHHELGRVAGGFGSRGKMLLFASCVLATARIHSNLFKYVRIASSRSLRARAYDDVTRNIFMVVLPSNDRISMIILSQMKQQASGVLNSRRAEKRGTRKMTICGRVWDYRLSMNLLILHVRRNAFNSNLKLVVYLKEMFGTGNLYSIKPTPLASKIEEHDEIY